MQYLYESRFRLEDGYDVSRLSSQLDMVLLKGFDFNLERKDGARHHAPLSVSGNDNDPLAQYFNVVSFSFLRSSLVFPRL